LWPGLKKGASGRLGGTSPGVRGQRGQRATGGEENTAAAELTCGESRSNSVKGAAQTGASGFRVKPGLGADLWWGSAGAVAQQGGVAAAA
jgi:hypothetical protein